MRKIILFSALLILSGCGSSDNETDDASSSICQRSDVNSQIFCALQRDYLWYSDLPTSIDPDSYSTPAALLEAVAAPQDRYSFILTRQEYEDRFINATFFGYGFSSMRADDNTALQIAYVSDDGSAAQNGLRRGDRITEIEGVSMADWLARLDAGGADGVGPVARSILAADADRVENHAGRRPHQPEPVAGPVGGTGGRISRCKEGRGR